MRRKIITSLLLTTLSISTLVGCGNKEYSKKELIGKVTKDYEDGFKLDASSDVTMKLSAMGIPILDATANMSGSVSYSNGILYATGNVKDSTKETNSTFEAYYDSQTENLYTCENDSEWTITSLEESLGKFSNLYEDSIFDMKNFFSEKSELTRTDEKGYILTYKMTYDDFKQIILPVTEANITASSSDSEEIEQMINTLLEDDSIKALLDNAFTVSLEFNKKGTLQSIDVSFNVNGSVNIYELSKTLFGEDSEETQMLEGLNEIQIVYKGTTSVDISSQKDAIEIPTEVKECNVITEEDNFTWSDTYTP